MMKSIRFELLGIGLLLTFPLRADPQAHLEKDVKKLERLQTVRDRDSDYTDKAQNDVTKGNADLAGHRAQLSRDVEHLKKVEIQVTDGQKQKSSPDVMTPLLDRRRTLKGNIQDGGRQVHNDKTVLGVQQRALDSNARYLAIEDRQIKKVEGKISDDQKALTQTSEAAIPPDAKKP